MALHKEMCGFCFVFFSIEVPVSSYLNKVISKTGIVHYVFGKDWAFILHDRGWIQLSGWRYTDWVRFPQPGFLLIFLFTHFSSQAKKCDVWSSPSLCSVPSNEHLKRRHCPHVIILCLRIIYENVCLMKSHKGDCSKNFKISSLFTEQRVLMFFPVT